MKSAYELAMERLAKSDPAAGKKLTAEQKTAWAYCRIKIAADRVNATACDEATAATAVRDLTEALQLAPQSAELQKVGQRLLKVAETKAGTAKAVAPVVASGDVIETASVRVHHGGNRELGEAVAKAAEAGRQQIFERWSGPPGGAWAPKCDVVIHATADAYAKATGKPAALTGHASVQLTGGRATSRRIDLRADDSALLANALPRELTHVVMADMFADRPIGVLFDVPIGTVFLAPTARVLANVLLIAEAGLPQGGTVSVAGTPDALVTRLNQEVARVLNRPDIRQRFLNEGLEAAGGPVEQLTTTIRTETARFAKLIKDAGIRVR